ncbi:MAG: hypothetical protein H6559_09145 [Lewinellaceae bacterium]|nr:hypothetical protein [Lewinellaceae bacterium]
MNWDFLSPNSQLFSLLATVATAVALRTGTGIPASAAGSGTFRVGAVTGGVLQNFNCRFHDRKVLMVNDYDNKDRGERQGSRYTIFGEGYRIFGT